MRRILLLLAIVLSVFNASGQSNEGFIHFSMQYSDSELSKEEMAAMPTESDVWFKGDQLKMHLPMGMGMESSVLINKDDVHVLLDLMGNKMAIKTSKKEMDKDPKGGKRFKLKSISEEVKDIAGYQCKKAIMSADGEPDMVIWFTDKLKADGAWYYNMDGINGFPLEFSLKTSEINARMVAKEIKLEKLNDKLFEIPAGYKVMTQAEMMKALGGTY